MNQYAIGKYISEKRKNKSLTQRQLADNLNVSEKTISKWECGKGLPEVSLMQPLCKELDISVNELLSGKDELNKNDNTGVIEYIKDNNKKNKIKIILSIIIFIVLISIIVLILYFANNYGKTSVYSLNGKTKNFLYEGGTLVVSDQRYVLTTGGIEIINNEISEKDILKTSLISGNKMITTSTIIKGTSTFIEDVGYEEIFSKESIDDTKNWYFEIQYIVDGELVTEKVKLNFNLLLKTDKFLPSSVPKIGNKNNSREEGIKETYGVSEEKFDEWISQRNRLLKEGFTPTDYFFYVEKITKTKSYTEKIGIDLAAGCISYKKTYDKKNYININYYEFSSYKKKYSVHIGKLVNDDYYYYDYSPEENVFCDSELCNGSEWQEGKDIYNILSKYIEKVEGGVKNETNK